MREQGKFGPEDIPKKRWTEGPLRREDRKHNSNQEADSYAIRHRAKFDRTCAETMGSLPLAQTASNNAIAREAPSRLCAGRGSEAGRMADGGELAGQDRPNFLG